MNPDRVVAFALVALVLIVIPGPSVLFVIGRALSLGKRPALATVLGNSAGEYVQVLAVALGIGALVERSVVAVSVVRLAGAAYLVILGIRAFRHRRSLGSALQGGPARRSRARVVGEGFAVGLTNPKSLAFFVAVLPQFVDPAQGHPAVQLLLLGLVWVAIALASDSAWALLAGQARSWLGRSPRRLEVLGGAGGVAMVGLGVSLVLTQRRQ